MIERAGILFNSLPEEKFDDPLGISTGAAVIFGATGGVMEAALRTAVYKLTGENVTDLPEVRGTKDIKEATYNVAGTDVNVIVTSGLANARKVLDSIRDGSCKAQFIEIMACPGGCVNGGGQPQVPMGVRNFVDIREERAKVLYNLDKSMPLRQSHENPAIKKVYEEFFEKPGSHKAHEVLHTSYIKRKVNEI
jgi:NADP-reducing hydrogenase subunit HndD